MRTALPLCLAPVLVFYVLALCLSAQVLRAEVTLLPAATDPAQGGREMVIYSSLDAGLAVPLLQAFQAGHPGLAIRYEDLLTGEIHDRIVAESDAADHRPTADFVFSSAMDLQIKLVNDGYGRVVITPDTAGWPDWAMWRETAYALTYEPAVFAWHKPSFAGHKPPATRADLLRWLEEHPDEARGRIGTYDITRSGVGYLFLARDQDLFPGIWEVIAAMGQSGVQQYPTSGELLERISTGEIAVGYNLLGSYVAEWARQNPETVGMTLPQDFTVVVSRVALVPREAANPDLGEALLAWLMSPEGQKRLSQTLRLPAVSLGVGARETSSGALNDLTGLRLKPVPVGPGLLAYLDHATRQRLFARWTAAMGGDAAPAEADAP